MSIFDSVASVSAPKRNNFPLGHENKLTAGFGKLYPVYWDELVPGDSFRISLAALVRLMPLQTPIMQSIQVDFHCFVVPYRLLCRDWKKFIFSAEADKPVMPYVPFADLVGGTKIGSLRDYLGIPTELGSAAELRENWKDEISEFPLNIWPILAYNLIYQEEFRDEDLQPFTSPDDYSDVSDIIEFDNARNGDYTSFAWFNSYLELRYRAWRKDYFTSARPWAQKGTAPALSFTSEVRAKFASGFDTNVYGSIGAVANAGEVDATLVFNNYSNGNSATSGVDTRSFENVSLYTNPVEGLTASDFRTLFKLQQWMETNAVAGSRYLEGTKAHFGVRVKDSRAQEPEFIGMCSMPVQVNPVIQTSESSETSPQGHQAGVGQAVGTSRPFSYFATEHSCVMVIMSIRPRASYFQGLRRAWTRTDNLDYFWDKFQGLGEQAIRNMELFIPPYNAAINDGLECLDTFGYQSRYAEYRSSFDEIHGEFRDSLNNWHCARQFGNMPALNDEFVTINPETDELNRIFSYIKDDDKFVCQLYFNVQAKRPMQYHTRPAVV